MRFITVKSWHLKGRGDITVYVPTGLTKNQTTGSALPIVTLLHGVYGSHWAWALKAGVHQTAARLIEAGEISPMVIAMPSDGLWGDGSGYLAHSGLDFESWILEDVPDALIEAGLPVGAGSPRFIAGLSMGGYGALRLAARHPERFSAAGGLSSITDIEQFEEFVEEPVSSYGQPLEDASLVKLMCRQRDLLPPIRFDCGTEDLLIEHNRALHRALEEAGVSHVYAEYPGDHGWAYWTEHVATMLRFFDRVS